MRNPSWLEVSQCEKHPGTVWPHDDCPGPGMPLFADLDEYLQQVQDESSRAVSDEAELYADAADSCLAQAAQDHATQRKEVKMDRWSEDQVDSDPISIPENFQKGLLGRRDELNGLISRSEDQLRAYRLELNMISAALQAHDEYNSAPTMSTSAGNATRF